MFPRKLLLLIIDLFFKNKATVLVPAGSPISNTILIDANYGARACVSDFEKVANQFFGEVR